MMNCKLRHFFAFICLAFLSCSCKKTFSVLPSTDVPAGFDSVIQIKKWLTIGPFEFDTITGSPETSFFYEDLKPYGIEEGEQIDDAAVKKLLRKGAGVFISDEITLMTRLSKYVSGSIENKSNFYMIAKVNSAQNQDVTLMIDGAHSYAGWLNGEKLIEIRRKYSTTKTTEHFLNVSLKKGENIFFFKVNRGTNLVAWDLFCAIAPFHEAGRLFRVNYAGDFVVNPLVTDSLEIYAGPYMSGKVEVVDGEDKTVAEGSFHNQNFFVISGLNRLPAGFYKTILIVGGEKMEEMIFMGEYNTYAEQATVDAAKFTGSSSSMEDVKAALHVANHFKDMSVDMHSPSDIRYRNRNKVFWGYALNRMLHHAVPSTQIMTYRDEDGNSGEFIFYNGNRQRQNVPLAIIVPCALSGESLLEDWYVSHLELMEADHALASQYGFALALIYAGGKHYSAEKTEKEIAAIIKRLVKEYNIDQNNLFLIAECEGGRRALVQLSLSSGRFAACALTSPITLSRGSEEEAPINLIPRMGNTPIVITHGINDDVVPLEESRRFVEAAQKQGLPVEYLETGESHNSINKDVRRFAFEFFSKIIQTGLALQ